MICNYEWSGETLRQGHVTIKHHCSLDVDHVGEPHECRCGATRTLGHDDAETTAVEES